MSENQLTPEKVEALRLYVSAVTEFASVLRVLLPRDSVPQPLYEMAVHWAQEATDAGDRVYTGIAGDDAPKLKSVEAAKISNLILSAGKVDSMSTYIYDHFWGSLVGEIKIPAAEVPRDPRVEVSIPLGGSLAFRPVFPSVKFVVAGVDDGRVVLQIWCPAPEHIEEE